MTYTRAFKTGRSQAIHVPKEYRVSYDEKLIIQKIGDMLLIVPEGKQWETFLHGLNGFSDDFMQDGREQFPETERESL